MELCRPRYHFMPEKNWMNDPNGVCFYRGEYHLFYQYNPHGPVWGDIHWGHAKSRDLVHWEQLPIALSPDAEKGEIHCFSGCAVVSEGQPLLFYTSVGEGERGSRDGAELWGATGDSYMEQFERMSSNPLLTHSCHGGLDVKEWRDPFILKRDGTFYLLQGASIGERGCALIYESEDLIHWRFLNVFCRSEKGERIWECPNLLDYGETCVLVISPDAKPVYMMGTIGADHSLVKEAEGFIDHGGFEGFYAPNSFVDGRGRHIMIGWMPDRARGEYLKDAGWSGVQSIPRTVELADGELIMKPVEELACLRGEREVLRGVALERGDRISCQTHSRTFELLLTLEGVCDESECSVEFFRSVKDGVEEQTVIHYDGGSDTVCVDRSASSLSGLCSTEELCCRGTHMRDGVLKLHLFADCSTAELFINDREVISARVYPTREECGSIALHGKNMVVKELDIWELRK